MNDRLIRALTADGRVRVIGVNITQALNEAHRRHQLSAIATAVNLPPWYDQVLL